MHFRFVRNMNWQSQWQRSLSRPVVATALFVLLGSLSACSRFSSSSTAARDDLSLVPKESAAVFMVNIKDSRGTSLYQKVIEARDKDPKSAQDYRDFVQKCGIDPLNDIDSLFLAVPNNVQQSREYTLVMRGRYQPDTVTACARKLAAERQQPLSDEVYNGVHILSTEGRPSLAVLAKRAVVFGSVAGVRHAIDLHTGKLPVSESARENKELAAMLARTRTSDNFWWAAQVPSVMAERLRSSAQFGAAASLHSISGSMEAKNGLDLHSDLDLGSDADATALQGSVTNAINNLRQDSRLALIGMTSYADTITVSAKKSTFAVDIKLTPKQLEDLASRLSGLARSLPF